MSQFGTASDDVVRRVAKGPAGDVYVVGSTRGQLPGKVSAGRADAYVRSYDAAGREKWTDQFGSAADDQISGVTTDADGNLYVVGFTFGSLQGQVSTGSVDAFVRRYSPSMEVIWTRQFGTTADDYGFAVSADANGHVDVVGSTRGILVGQTSSGDEDVFVRRFDATGSEMWTRQFGSPATDRGYGIAVDGTGALNIVGMAWGQLPGQTSSGMADAFVRRYDGDGNEIWTRQFGGVSVDLADDIAVDGAGDIYVAGYTYGTLPGHDSLGGNDAFLRRYDAGGNEIWTRQFGSDNSDWAIGVTVDGAGNVFVAGFTYGTFPGERTAGGSDAFVGRFTSSGTQVWTLQFGSASDDQASAVITDGAGNLYVGGQTRGALSGSTGSGEFDAFVAKLFVQKDCENTSNPGANEEGPVSGAIHALEQNVPSDPNARSVVHETNCAVIVPAEYQYGLDQG